jgi:hypothetical protein
MSGGMWREGRREGREGDKASSRRGRKGRERSTYGKGPMWMLGACAWMGKVMDGCEDGTRISKALQNGKRTVTNVEVL